MANKVIKWLIIPIFVILLMSYNVSAIEFTKDVDLVQGNYEFTMRPNYWSCYNDSSCPTWDNSTYYRSFSSFGANITDIYVRFPNRTYVAGDWVVFDFYFFHSNTLANHSIFDGLKIGGSYKADVIDVKMEQLTDNSSHATVYLRFYDTQSISQARFYGNATLFQLQSASTAQYKAEVDAGIMTIWHEKSGTDYTNTINNITEQIQEQTQQQAEQNEKENEAVENIENQSPSDISTGDDTQATNLIGNITSIFNQIRDIPVGSNCSIPANWGNLNLGNLNLCTGKENMPFIVNFGATVFQLVFVVSTGLILVRQVLSLYDWSRK